MKFIHISMFILLIASIALSQSSVEIGINSEVAVDYGADICADNQAGEGELTGGGTWCLGVLPVELAGFSFELTRNAVRLIWKTSFEINNRGFEVQRSNDAKANWIVVGFAEGSGNSQTPREYTFQEYLSQMGDYHYRLRQIDYNGSYEYFELQNIITIGVPATFTLEQNYPNPFNPSTSISFSLPEYSRVKLSLFSISGMELMTLTDKTLSAGRYEFNYDFGSLPSGTYIYRLTATYGSSQFNAVRRMTLVK